MSDDSCDDLFGGAGMVLLNVEQITKHVMWHMDRGDMDVEQALRLMYHLAGGGHRHIDIYAEWRAVLISLGEDLIVSAVKEASMGMFGFGDDTKRGVGIQLGMDAEASWKPEQATEEQMQHMGQALITVLRAHGENAYWHEGRIVIDRRDTDEPFAGLIGDFVRELEALPTAGTDDGNDEWSKWGL